LAERLDATDYDTARLINNILNLYYIQEVTQAEIGQRLGLSTAKVNRLLKQARQQGLVSIKIRTPYQHLFSLESQLRDIFGLTDVVVIPTASDSNEAAMHALGQAGAAYLLKRLHDGDLIGIASGQAINALVQAVDASHSYDVTVVPVVGAVQGQGPSDVNYLASELANRLGGKGYQLHAPAFVDSGEHREALLSMSPVREILDIARRATIGIVGVGLLDQAASPSTPRSVLFSALAPEDMEHILNVDRGVGDIAAHVYDLDGRVCAPEYAKRVVGLTLEELQRIPLVVGLAATSAKAGPIFGALRGGYLHALVTDEAAAQGVLRLAEAHDFQRELAAGQPSSQA
jgi:DNA-binding transcriptional regulator LsrR (DeoR family)